MLANALVMATLPAHDLDRARTFYSEKLGLQPARVMEGGNGLQYQLPSSAFFVFQSSGAPSGTHTQMSFSVDDVDAVAAELRVRGVTFEDVEGLDQQDGIANMEGARGGWFLDSEGNLIGLVQELA